MSSLTLKTSTVVVEIYFLTGMVAQVAAQCGPFCSKDLSSGICSFLERFITNLFWILQVVEEVPVVLKVLVVLDIEVEDLEMSFLIWVFLYGRKVFSLLFSMVLCRFVKVWSSSFCCRDVLVLDISVWRWLILILVQLILFWMSEYSAVLFISHSNLLPFHLICKVFGFLYA